MTVSIIRGNNPTEKMTATKSKISNTRNAIPTTSILKTNNRKIDHVKDHAVILNIWNAAQPRDVEFRNPKLVG